MHKELECLVSKGHLSEEDALELSKIMSILPSSLPALYQINVALPLSSSSSIVWKDGDGLVYLDENNNPSQEEFPLQ